MIDIDRLSLQGGNVLLDDTVIFTGSNNLFEFYVYHDSVYVIGENLTFLQIHKSGLVEQVGWLAELYHRYQKHTL